VEGGVVDAVADLSVVRCTGHAASSGVCLVVEDEVIASAAAIACWVPVSGIPELSGVDVVASGSA